MGLLLSVDDQRNVAYKVLAEAWRAQQGVTGNVLVEFHSADQIEIATKMQKVIKSAHRKGCDCVMFVVDQESHDPSKRDLLKRIRGAFEELCANLSEGVTVGLIIAHSCLECWLLTDVQAIVRFQVGKRGVRYNPSQSGRTEKYNPPQAVEAITHIMRLVAQKRGVKDTKRVKYEKSRSGKIAEQMQDLKKAAQRNGSFGYFLEMVVCDQDGCVHRQPQRD